MPTVLRESGFDFRIYTDDHDPAHIHVVKGGDEAVITLGTETVAPSVRENHGMSTKNLRKAFLIVNENQPFFLQEWRRIYG
jgi:Domain of unknown function (DUF4160)